MSTRLTIRFDFAPERRLGPGKIALLEAIAATGSISGAGRKHKMSYRRAWLLVDELNKLFGEPLVRAHPGGAKGGGAALTAPGQKVLRAYRDAERKMREAAATEIAGDGDAARAADFRQATLTKLCASGRMFQLARAAAVAACNGRYSSPPFSAAALPPTKAQIADLAPSNSTARPSATSSSA